MLCLSLLQALHVAAMRSQLEVVKALLAAGMSPDVRSARGWTPLEEALAARHQETALLLQVWRGGGAEDGDGFNGHGLGEPNSCRREG